MIARTEANIARGTHSASDGSCTGLVPVKANIASDPHLEKEKFQQ